MVTKSTELLKSILILLVICVFYTRGNQLHELLKRLARTHNYFYVYGLKKEPTINLKATQTK